MAHYLVTGGAGFIGSHIAERLVHDGHSVRILDNLSSGRLGNIASFRPKVEFIEGDIRDRGIVRQAVKDIDYIIHEAAWRSVPKSMSDPYGYTEVNILATVNVLEAACAAKVKRIVLASSSSVYGDTDKVPLREDQPTAPISPYAQSKLCGEHHLELFARSFGIEAVSVRYFNVFGPRQSLENEYAVVIPKFIACLLKKQSPPVYGDGTQSRDFTYVQNIVEGTILASQVPGVSGDVFNIALGEEHSVLNLLEELNKIMGLNIAPAFQPHRPGDVKRTLADPSKANKLLKWKGSVKFAEGLKRTVEWFKANPPA